MRPPQYTRYALRLGAGAAPSPAAAPCATAALATAAPPAAEPGVIVDDVPADGWSGAVFRAVDPQALDYRFPEAVALIGDLPVDGWQEDDDGATLVFWLEDGAEAKAEVGAVLRRLGALGRLEAGREPPGWELAWRRFHRPRVIGRVRVRPPWYPPEEGLLDVVVEAGMAFGTGGHASTRQCLEILQTLAPGSLLDLGSGSGVISLAALRLGFAPVTGIEIDPVAVRAAAGNAAMNDLDATFVLADATDPSYPLPEADVVVANIALRPILRLAERWRGAAEQAADADASAGSAEPHAPALGEASSLPRPAEDRQGAPASSRPDDLVLSGLLVDQADEVLAVYPGFVEAARSDDGTWLTLHLARRA